jgi:single-strand DNA-binding protein
MSNETVITIIGNLTNDPTLRFTASGTAVASFTIASTPRTYDKESGGWKDGDALFLRCSAWRQLAEHVAESLVKGDRVIAQGKLSQRTYEKDGQNVTVIECEVTDIGPSLVFRIARPAQVERSSKPKADPWADSAVEPPF